MLTLRIVARLTGRVIVKVNGKRRVVAPTVACRLGYRIIN